MYYCKDCKKKFNRLKTIYENHGFKNPPFEVIGLCPECNSSDVRLYEIRHCKNCGARLPMGTEDYCNQKCRYSGEIMWEREKKRLRIIAENPIAKICRELSEYNKKNGTLYTYGQYVVLVNKNERNENP